MGIVLGATRAQLKKAGVKVAKGVRTTAEALGLTSQKSTTAAGIAKGSIKPSIPNTVSIPSPVSGIVMTANAVGRTETSKGLAQSFVDLIPDIPGTSIDNKIKDFVVEKPVTSALIAAAAVGTLGGVAYAVSKKKKSTKKKSTKKKSTKKKSTKKKSTKKKKSKSGYGTEAAYNRKGGKKVYYTKNKQPYILLASGKARFIKKSR